jgi:hypothetical protein
MRPFWGRLLWRTGFVGVALAGIGYALARGFLLIQRMYGGGAYNEANETVLWQTPLNLAVFGMVLTFALEFVIGSLRKPAPVKSPTDPNGA